MLLSSRLPALGAQLGAVGIFGLLRLLYQRNLRRPGVP